MSARDAHSYAKFGYAELHCFSNFSFLRGASHSEELVERAAELGYAALAITDRNSLAGVVRAHMAAKEHGLHLIIGAEIMPIDARPLVLLAPDRPAYARLARLLTRGKLRTPKGECAVRLSDIAELSEGLIAIVLPLQSERAAPANANVAARSPRGRHSPVADPQPVNESPSSRPIDSSAPWPLGPLLAYKHIFPPENLFLAAELCYDLPDGDCLARLDELSARADIPLVAANNVHYHIPERRYLQDVLTCIREQCTLTDAGHRLFPNAERHLRPLDEIARRYAGHESAVARTLEIAKRCTFTLDELRYEYPHEVCPPDVTPMEHLERLTWAGAAKKYSRRHVGIEARRHEDTGATPNSGDNDENQDVSRPDRMAEVYGASQTDLSNHHADARDREVWPDVPDASGCSVDTVQHCGGIRAVELGGLHPLPESGERILGRTSDTTDSLEPTQIHPGIETTDRITGRNRSSSSGSYPKHAESVSQVTTEQSGARRLLTPKSSCLRASVPSCLSINVRNLLTAELRLISELKYEHYFLTVHDLVRFARSRGILCQGRGSAANSAVCYCLGITAVDPARIDLLFERFISRERNEPPDIDVDFEHERREEVFQYIYNKYGRERAAITGEVITYRPRSAVRDVGKALGLSLETVDKLAKALEWSDDEPVNEEVVRNIGLDPNDRTIQMLMRLAKQILRFPRHLSQHVGGFVITESPLCEIVPLENGAMPDRTFIEWDKDDIDALGILKVDCLALGMLTAISKCFALLKGFRDSGIKGLRDLNTQTNGDAHVGQTDVSGPDRVAESNVADQGGLHGDYANAGFRTIRPDQPDASGGRVDSEQHSGGQRATESKGLHSISNHGSRLSGGIGNAIDYRAGTDISPPGHHSDGIDARGLKNASGVNCQPAAKDGLRTRSASECQGRDPGIEGLRDSGIQKSAVFAGEEPAKLPQPARNSPWKESPQSLNPLIPQSLLDLPPEDPAVYDMICRADTVGVFQIESRAQMSMLPRLKPRCFYDLVIEVAIVRPGPIQGGMVHPYLRRREGIEPVTYPSEAVKQVLAKTLGVPLFQEQVMRLAVVAAGFTPGEADQLRRAMAAWRRSGKMQQFQIKLVKGMLKNGYSKRFAEQIYKQISGFAEYGFPESHSASFSLLVYASAWLKRHHPAPFCAALLNSQPLGFYTPGQLVRDAIDHGVAVLPIDVNYSEYDCTLENRDQGIKGLRDQGRVAHSDGSLANPPNWGRTGAALRLGIRLVRGISAEKVRGILAVRREAQQRSAEAASIPQSPNPSIPILSIEQLDRRDDVSRETLLRLAAADAFRSLGLNRRQALWRILALDDVESSLFSELEPTEPAIELPKTPIDEVVVQDYDSIGFSLNAHPIGLVRRELNAMRIGEETRPVRVIPHERLKHMRNGQRVAVAGLVTLRQRPYTAKGTTFMTLEDENAMANLIIRPNVWKKYRYVARSKVALVAEGMIERQGEVIHVMVRHLYDLSDRLRSLRHRSRDFQ